ncbi:MAG TPA: hypothetical protein VI757_07310 [Bacteroidia bacterium]|nr:hypothetical protein [Bacteroidia bacterium]
MRKPEISLRFFPSALLLLAGAMIFFSSCKKYEEETFLNNYSPPDYTVDSVAFKLTIENYVIKSYISALGREPDSAEKSFGFNLLFDSNLSMNSRYQFLDSVFSNPEFIDKFYERARIDLLQGLDTSEITFQIYIIEVILIPSITNTADSIFIDFYQAEADRLKEMKEIPDSLHAGVIDFKEAHRRCVNNIFYDQLNMGSFNFVVSMFQHFLDRYPTTNEQLAGVNMVNGNSAVLFLVAGQSKNDFLNIFFSSDDYYEGQVLALYRQYLFRTPTTIEMSNGTLLYITTQDFIELQKSILSKNEFIGI